MQSIGLALWGKIRSAFDSDGREEKEHAVVKAFASHVPCFEINEDLARAELERDDDTAYLAALPSARADAKRKAILSQVQLVIL